MADERQDRAVREGESYSQWAARVTREANADGGRGAGETERIGREAQRRATAHSRARGQL